MEYLIFSDIHGNLPAFETVLKCESHVQGYINLGDVVNYGPWSNECVQLVDSLNNCINIRGNHEVYFNQGVCEVKNSLVQFFFDKTYNSFVEHSIIEKYKPSMDFEGFKLVHTLNNKYIFRDSDIEVDKNFMIGHSHQQFLRFINNRILLNPGSVGQNRRFINLSNYAIWNLETGEFSLKTKKYDINQLLSKMKEENYPEKCLDYYNNKKQY